MAMKKFINQPENLVPELLEGAVQAYSNLIALAGGRLVVRAAPKDPGKVALVSMGGSGHEPFSCGYVGEGMLDVGVPGEIFSAPGAPRCMEALKLVERPAGTLFIVLNHEGDVLSSNMTMQMAKRAGLKVKKVLVSEDISSAPRSDPENRRGLIGALVVYKVAGAAAEEGRSLDEVVELAERAGNNVATLAVALAPATHPATGHLFFSLPDDEMEIGMGQHGEAGTGRMKLKTADETADIMLNRLLEDLSVQSGEEVVVILNGAGATTLMELFIIMRRVSQVLAEKKIKLVGSRVGELLTVQEQAGFQMCVARMDAEMLRLWNAPCNAPTFYTK